MPPLIVPKSKRLEIRASGLDAIMIFVRNFEQVLEKIQDLK